MYLVCFVVVCVDVVGLLLSVVCCVVLFVVISFFVHFDVGYCWLLVGSCLLLLWLLLVVVVVCVMCLCLCFCVE